MLRNFIKANTQPFWDAHAAEAEIWQSSAEAGVAGLEQIPDEQEAIAHALQNTHFYRGVGRRALRLAQGYGKPGEIGILTTLSDEDFDDINRVKFMESDMVLGASYYHFAKRNIGVVSLRPAATFNELDRAAIISHELKHADFAFSGLGTRTWTLNGEPVSSHTMNEVQAYRVGGAIIDNGTDGDFSKLVVGLKEKYVEAFAKPGRSPKKLLLNTSVEGEAAQRVLEASATAKVCAHVIALSSLATSGEVPLSALENILRFAETNRIPSIETLVRTAINYVELLDKMGSWGFAAD